MERGVPPYRQVLGTAFEALPVELRDFHDTQAERRWVGTCDIRQGGGALARLLAALFGFPPPGIAVPLSVTVTPTALGETWTRDFGGSRLRSTQWAGKRGDARLLFERFGPVSVGSVLLVEGGRLQIIPSKGSLFGVPLPAWLLPHGEAFEASEQGCFAFDVSIHAPFVGLLVAYHGRLSLPPPDGDAQKHPSEPRHAVARWTKSVTNRSRAP